MECKYIFPICLASTILCCTSKTNKKDCVHLYKTRTWMCSTISAQYQCWLDIGIGMILFQWTNIRPTLCTRHQHTCSWFSVRTSSVRLSQLPMPSGRCMRWFWSAFRMESSFNLPAGDGRKHLYYSERFSTTTNRNVRMKYEKKKNVE